MNKHGFRVFPVLLGLLLAVLSAAGFAQDWYISNAAGMTLERAFSRLALRNKYALSIETIAREDFPERLRAFYNPEYQPELRTLYENGEESRRQWIFKDGQGISRLVAVFNGDGSGFIELYDPNELITGEYRIAADGSEYITRYIYNNSLLIRAETRRFTPPPPPPAEDEAETGDEAESGDGAAPGGGAAPANGAVLGSGTAPGTGAAPGNGVVPGSETAPEDEARAGDPWAATVEPGAGGLMGEIGGENREGVLEDMWTDYYRYSRFYSLRAVERRYHQALPEEQAPVRLQFPHMVLQAAEQEFIAPGSSYGSGFFSEILVNSGDRVLYTTDERGRVLTETRKDEDDVVLGELQNTWSGDRLASVSWKAGENEQLTEYEYNEDGDRVLERNYVNGVLERVVRREGEQEVEELYMNGVVILRALWEDGRKISEERVRPQPGRGE
ncbi:MAG: hypothetical protein LBP93_05280 [Treponema sp.]|nr:hypothetical protein [Treponema sp.]